ncbi:hypothetical protein [Streptomyces scabiei]|uniref:hypothetical protein n=1 Tax=Streptomyces scabiei TaxID=1930 RepID=UPI0029A85ADA|nr:hypothetical protein [Streptomyces scabiei]MDX3028619.1 hypothetical protein [Streptomyces scabiei]
MRALNVSVRLAATVMAVAAAAGCMSVGDEARTPGPSPTAGQRGGEKPDGGTAVTDAEGEPSPPPVVEPEPEPTRPAESPSPPPEPSAEPSSSAHEQGAQLMEREPAPQAGDAV